MTANDRSACELCEAAQITPWLFEDEMCWIADCEACDVPMVVWKVHDPDPPADLRASMLERLAREVDARYADAYFIDERMRTIPDHFHAHARPRGGYWSQLRRSAQ